MDKEIVDMIEAEAVKLYPIHSNEIISWTKVKRNAYIAGRSKSIEEDKKKDERIKELEDLLQECDDYFDNYADANYINEQFSPNPEMNLLSRIRNLLTK